MTLKALIPLPALVMTVAALMLPAPAAHAIPIPFGGILSGANEVPPVDTPGAGSVTVVLDPTAQTIQILASFFGLTAPDTAAHIHCCQTMPGTNVGVATTVPAFDGFPLGVTQGTYLSPIFSLADPSFYNPVFVDMFPGGLPEAEAALIAGIENGLTYFTSTPHQTPVERSEPNCFPSVSPAPSSVPDFRV